MAPRAVTRQGLTERVVNILRHAVLEAFVPVESRSDDLD
jgi:hypothetical protein